MRAPAAPAPGATRSAGLGLIGSCHPVPTVGVTAIAVLLAVGVGLDGGSVALFGAAVFTGQLSIGWSNDRIDAARDARSGRGDKPAAAGAVPLGVLSVAAGAALIATLVLSALLGVPAGPVALVLVAAGWAYNLGLKATVWSGLAYVVGFAALPAAAYLARTGHPGPPWWAPTVGALLGLGAHFANVLPDLRADADTGVRGLPQRLGPRNGVLVMAAALAAAAVVLALGPAGVGVVVRSLVLGLGIAAAGVVTVLAIRRPDDPAAFRVTVMMALADVVVFLLVVRR